VEQLEKLQQQAVEDKMIICHEFSIQRDLLLIRGIKREIIMASIIITSEGVIIIIIITTIIIRSWV
jgi:hypothetical protein